MPSILARRDIEDGYDELNMPVVSLKEGLPLRELIANHQTEFEVTPEEDEGNEGTRPESCFEFHDIEKVINLNMIDVEMEDGEDGTPFDRYRRKMFDIRDDGKLKKFVVKQGVGPLVPGNALVYLRYQGYVEYMEVPFDSTLWQCNGEGDLPVSVNLSKGELIPGLHEAIISMRRGEKAEVLIHPDLAFGRLGCPPRIPPDATVLFIIEVERFVDCGDVLDNQDHLDMYERRQFCNVYKTAKTHSILGNEFFSQNKYSAALNKYRNIINMMHNARLANDEEEKERNHFLVKIYTNTCVCYKKLKNYRKICSMAADAVRVDEALALGNYKLLYFWGYAKMMLGDYGGAKNHLRRAQTLRPHESEISKALRELERKRSDAIKQERIMMQRAFGNIIPSTEVTLSEVDEREEEFRKTVKEELEKFANDRERESVYIKDQHLTKDEENVYLQVAKALGLYARVVEGEKRVIHVKKPNDF